MKTGREGSQKTKANKEKRSRIIKTNKKGNKTKAKHKSKTQNVKKINETARAQRRVKTKGEGK